MPRVSEIVAQRRAPVKRLEPRPSRARLFNALFRRRLDIFSVIMILAHARDSRHGN
jgi:hypothetical protein